MRRPAANKRPVTVLALTVSGVALPGGAHRLIAGGVRVTASTGKGKPAVWTVPA